MIVEDPQPQRSHPDRQELVRTASGLCSIQLNRKFVTNKNETLSPPEIYNLSPMLLFYTVPVA